MSTKDSFFSTSYKPYYQAAIAFGIMLVLILSSKLMEILGVMDVSVKFPWKMVGTFLLVYIIFSCLYSIGAKNKMIYWRDSILSYAALLGLGILLASFASSTSIYEVGSYHWLFKVLSIVYIVFLTLVNMLTTFMDYAENEEWDHPRGNK